MLGLTAPASGVSVEVAGDDSKPAFCTGALRVLEAVSGGRANSLFGYDGCEAEEHQSLA
jgi:hypothetical protein